MITMQALSKFPPWIILAAGFAAGYVKAIWRFFYDHTIGHIMNRISLLLSIEDFEHWDAYTWLNFWAEKHLRDRHISSLLLQRRETHWDDDDDDLVPFGLIPHYGTYYMRWKGRPLVITHSKETGDGRLKPLRTFSVRLWFCSDRALLLDILEQARSEYEADNPNGLCHYTSDGYGEWYRNPLVPRPLETLFLPNDLTADILNDLGSWLRKEDTYRQLHIPYQRGYLFYGPPGGGKTTVIKALASLHRLPIFTLTIHRNTSSATLSRLLKRCGGPCILLLEDVDCIPVTHRRRPAEGEPEEDGSSAGPDLTSSAGPDLTLSDLLNMIDGIGAADKRLIVMTSNHPDKIDPALVRSGRVDRQWELTYAQDPELRRFYDRAAGPFELPEWSLYRAALAPNCTIADAQALAVRGGR